MLQHKGTTILSEIKDFFTTSEKAINTLFTVMSSLTISDRLLREKDKPNSRYSGKNKLFLLLLFPFFEIKDASHYPESALHRILKCGKDVFYRFINDSHLPWRKQLYLVNKKLLKGVEKKSKVDNQRVKCLIVDDTDLPKKGRCIELIGRVFSHVTHSSILAFKGLFLGYHDGKSFYALDFSLHGEKGKNEKRPYGMTKKEIKRRYSKKRDKESFGGKRVEEYFMTKIESLLSMIRLAIREGIRFDYLLVDSWFTCFEIVRFITTRRIGCHLLGMIKMGKTKYNYNGISLTSKEIVAVLGRKKKTKRSKRLNCWYSEAIVEMKGIEVKLFFCKTSRKGNWNGLLSTNVQLDFEEAYRIYSTRWTIEVYFKESKQYLGLGKCQSQDFDAQIASTSICMLQYNLLSAVKRFAGYETMGELFRQAQAETLELTVNERIWQIITEILTEIAELFDADTEWLMEKLFSENEKFTKWLNFKPLLQAG
jgi:hypothetical protein